MNIFDYADKGSMSCCGTAMANGTPKDPQTFVKLVHDNNLRGSYTFLTWSGPALGPGGSDPYGNQEIEKFIKDNELGELTVTPYLLNKRHGPYKVAVWAWAVDWKKLDEFCKPKEK